MAPHAVGLSLQLHGGKLLMSAALLRCCAAVRRLREMREQPIGGIRFIAVSATIPNLQDVADWLSVPPSGIKCFGGCGWVLPPRLRGCDGNLPLSAPRHWGAFPLGVVPLAPHASA